MREMECVRPGPAQDEYLNKLLKEAGIRPKFLAWDDVHLSVGQPLLLFINEDHIEAVKKICEDRELKLIIALNARRDFKLVSKIKNNFEKIFGFIDLSQEIEYNVPILKNYLTMNFTNNAISLEKLASDLDKVYEFTKSELIRVKDLHDRLVKVRVDTLKGVTVTSKFMAGEKSGGEFFDMLQTDNNFLFIHAGSDSYILSSLILSELEVLKLSAPTTSIKSQSENFEKMIKHHASELGVKLNYCILNLDVKTFQVDCKFQGEGALYYQNQLMSFSAPAKFKLNPNEKIHLLSAGALKNLSILNPDLTVEAFYKTHADKATRELINEFFFEVSRNKPGNFLIYDALMNVIEVEYKTLYQL